MTLLQLSLSSTDLAASLIRSPVQSLMSSFHRLLGRPYLCSLERSPLWCPSLSNLLSSLCRIITCLGLVVFIFRITVSAIYLALWLLFTLCMFELHYSVDLNELNDDDDDVHSSSASVFLCELTVTSPLLALIVPIRLSCDLSTKLSILFGSTTSQKLQSVFLLPCEWSTPHSICNNWPDALNTTS